MTKRLQRNHVCLVVIIFIITWSLLFFVQQARATGTNTKYSGSTGHNKYDIQEFIKDILAEKKPKRPKNTHARTLSNKSPKTLSPREIRRKNRNLARDLLFFSEKIKPLLVSLRQDYYDIFEETQNSLDYLEETQTNFKQKITGRFFGARDGAMILSELAKLLVIVQKCLNSKMVTAGDSSQFEKYKKYCKYALLASLPVLSTIGFGNYMNWWIIATEIGVKDVLPMLIQLL